MACPRVVHDDRHQPAADAIRLLAQGRWTDFAVLGGVFLAITGGEALYANMGHIGRGPIRFSWYAIVLPALLLNYVGQTALLFDHTGFAEGMKGLFEDHWRRAAEKAADGFSAASQT